MITKLIEIVYSFLWGDLIQIPLPGGSSVGISLLIILLIPMGIYFTVRTRFLPIRLFPDMVRALVGTKAKKDADGKSDRYCNPHSRHSRRFRSGQSRAFPA
jgi:AGCS family alanine or glycine:cation symporter